ncbi:MAG: helix-turn-helix domain-containing protein [Planctomycetota bacterium]
MADRPSGVFYTVKQIAEKLQISLSMVYGLLARGELACHEFGNCKRISEGDLESFLSSRRNDGPKRPSPRGKHF